MICCFALKTVNDGDDTAANKLDSHENGITRLTHNSTFKPKSLKNQAHAIELLAKRRPSEADPNDKLLVSLTHQREMLVKKTSVPDTATNAISGDARKYDKAAEPPFKVRLRPTGKTTSSTDIWTSYTTTQKAKKPRGANRKSSNSYNKFEQ